MKALTRRTRRTAFTLVESAMAMAVLVVVGFISFYLLNTGTMLYAKNFSLNVSNASLRIALDRMNREIRLSMSTPELINTSTNGTILANQSGNAAGVRFDKFLGGTYVVVNPGSGLSGATSFTLQRSTNVMASPPIPINDDVVLIDGTATRCVVNTCTVTSSTNNLQNLAVTMQSGTSVSVSWASSDIKSAELLHQVIFLVVGNQLRYYANTEGVTNINNISPTNILTYDVGTSTGESTPFSILTQNGSSFLYIALRIQKTQGTGSYNNYLANKELGQFNSFVRIDTMLYPRNTTLTGTSSQ